MKRVFLSVLFMAVAVQAHAATKVTCTGNGLSFDLAQDSVTSDTKPKFENVSAKNAIVERNLAQASKLGLIGPDQDGFDPGAKLYQGQFTSPSPQGTGTISLSIKPNGLAQLQWDDDDAGMLTVELKCQ
jgi:hypothetical protein